MNLRRLIIGFYFVLFLSVGIGSGVFFWQTRQEYNRLLDQEAVARQRLAEVETRLREQERVLQRLRTDPEYVEKVIRRRLGYARADEFVFRFEE